MKTTILKTITLLAICLCSLNSYGQTQEETINWLKDKLTSCLVPTEAGNEIKIIYFNECQFEYQIVLKNNETHYTQYIVPITNIVITDKGEIKNKSVVIKRFSSDNHTSEFVYKTFFSGIRNCEEDIYGRLQKALDHLSTFCPKKKETF